MDDGNLINALSGEERADIRAALAEPSFASLARSGAPIVVAQGDPVRVVFANSSAMALFQTHDAQELTRRLFPEEAEGADLRLRELSRSILPDAAARLERLTFTFGATREVVTILCRRTGAHDAPLFVFAALGLRARSGDAQSVHDDAAPAPERRPALVLAGGSDFAAPPASVAEPMRASAPETFAALREKLRKRPGGWRDARFLWRTDAQRRIVDITPPLAAIVGAGHAAWIGHDFFEMTKAMGLDPQDRFALLFAARTTWSGEEVDWPIEAAAAAVPVSLGALPVFDRQRVFEGWRGYGVVHLARLHEAFPLAPLAIADVDANPEPAGALTRTLELIEAGLAHRSDDAPARDSAENAPSAAPAGPAQEEQAAATTDESGARQSDALAAIIDENGTVPRLQHEPPSIGEPANENGENPLPATEGTVVRAFDRPAERELELSPLERNAFREIARTLGARVQDAAAATSGHAASNEKSTAREPDQRDADAARTASAARALTPVGAAVEDGRLADQLPFGLVVRCGQASVYVNQTLLGWLGYRNASDFHANGGFGRMLAAGEFERLTAEGSRALLASASGEQIAVDARVLPINWGGAPASLFCAARARDEASAPRVEALIAQLRAREKQLAQTNAILDTAADGALVIDAQGQILEINRSGEALFGYDRDEAIGQPFSALLVKESQTAAAEYFEKMKSGGFAAVLNEGREVMGRARQGGAIPLFMTLGRIDASDEARYCAVLRDMTYWKKAEGELFAARAQAEGANQAKSDFLAKISHEIRTPLNAILGFTEVIIDERFGPIGNERYKDYLKDIHASGAHVMSLVNDLLDLSKIEAGKLDLNFVALDANRVIAECVSLLQPQANRERVIMRLSLSQGLPAVIVDERALRQIVLNLLSNAVKYNEPGGQVIVSTAMAEQGRAVLRVKDTGVGMSEDEIKTAMEPFRQIATSRNVTGTGLGLPLTKALVEANRASFSIKSRKAEGTLVEIGFLTEPAAAH